MQERDRSVQLTLTEQDVAAAARLYTWGLIKAKSTIVAGLALLAILVGLIFADGSLMVRAPLIGAIAGLLLMPFVNYAILAPYGARRNYRRQKTLHYPMTVSWSETAVRTVAEQGDWSVAWRDYLKWLESDDVILLYQSARLYNLLPKRALAPAQLHDIRQVIAESVTRG